MLTTRQRLTILASAVALVGVSVLAHQATVPAPPSGLTPAGALLPAPAAPPVARPPLPTLPSTPPPLAAVVVLDYPGVCLYVVPGGGIAAVPKTQLPRGTKCQ